MLREDHTTGKQKSIRFNLLILNDRDYSSGFGGQASFINNLHPFLNEEFTLKYLILSEGLQKQKFIPVRLLYLLKVLFFMIRRKNNYDCIISHTPEASFAVSFFRTPFIHIFHGNANPLSMSTFWYGKYFKWIFNLFEARISGKARLLYTVGEFRKDAGKIYTPISFRPERILTFSERKDFVFSGRLESVKNIDIIISRYNMLPENIKSQNKLHIIGTGSREENLKMLAGELNLQEQVVFHGLIKNETVIDIMRHSLIILMASTFEGFPMAIAESLTVGTPVVSTNVGDIQSVIKDGYNGFFLENKCTPEEFNEKIIKILADYEHFSANAVRSSSVFNAAEIAGALISACNQILTYQSRTSL